MAGYLGLFSIFLIIPAPFAIGFGMWGLRVARDANGHGRGRCVFGIIGGLIGLLWAVLIALSS